MTNLEDQKELVMSKDDLDNIENFFSHFEMEMPKDLRNQLDAWKHDPDNFTVEKEKALTNAVAEALVKSKHKIFEADVWKGILSNASETYYNAQFDKDLEEVLTEE